MIGFLERLRRGYEGTGFEPIRPWFLRRAPRIERPIRVYIGRRGHGKTLNAAYDCVQRLRRGERVYANIDIVDPHDPSLRTIRLRSWKDICDVEAKTYLSDCTIFIDEMSSWADARLWNEIPGFVRAYWQQSRKHGVGFICTAQSWESVDKRFREITDHVIICEKVMGRLIPDSLPLFRQRWAWPEDLRFIEANQAPELEATHWWSPAWVYASYRTGELVAIEEHMRKDDLSQTLIQLMQDAAGCTQ